MSARLSRMVLVSLLVGIVFLAPYSVRAQNGDQLPTLSELEDTWNYLAPGGETSCAFGDPFGFFVHPGSSDHLMIAFGGSLICWDDSMHSCLLYPEALIIDVEARLEIFFDLGGIFELDNPANPVADYTMVIVPDCTGDTHLGHRAVRYGEGDDARNFAHNGFANVNAVLEWVYANMAEPDRIAVIGQSSGMPASIFYAPFVIEHYPDAAVVQIGNGLGAYATDSETFEIWGTADILPEWMAEYDGITAETLTFETFYIVAATHYPDHVFAQTNSAYDTNLRTEWATATGGTPPFAEALVTNMQDIASQVPNFRYFIAGGSESVPTSEPIFYTVRVGDVLFRDWYAALINGQEVENVACIQCDVADVGQDMSPPEPVENPTYPAGSTVTVPGPGVMFVLAEEPGGGTGAGSLCTVGTEATVLQTVQTAAGEIWVELECAGMSGWALEETLSGQ